MPCWRSKTYLDSKQRPQQERPLAFAAPPQPRTAASDRAEAKSRLKRARDKLTQDDKQGAHPAKLLAVFGYTAETLVLGKWRLQFRVFRPDVKNRPPTKVGS